MFSTNVRMERQKIYLKMIEKGAMNIQTWIEKLQAQGKILFPWSILKKNYLVILQ